MRLIFAVLGSPMWPSGDAFPSSVGLVVSCSFLRSTVALTLKFRDSTVRTRGLEHELGRPSVATRY